MSPPAPRILGFVLVILLVSIIGCSEEATQAPQNCERAMPASLLDVAPPDTPMEPQTSTEPPPPLPGVPLSVDGLTLYGDRATFDEAFPGLPVEDFEEANVGERRIVPCPHPLNENSDNNCFSPGDILSGINIMASNDQFGFELAVVGKDYFLNPSKNVAVTVFPDAQILEFPNGGVLSVGMDLHVYFHEENLLIDIHGNSGLLGSTQATANSQGRFWGVSSDEVITMITILSLTNQAEAVDNISFQPANLDRAEVEIDIKPGSDRNPIKIGARGKIPVAILTTDDFDAAAVDPQTVALGDGDGDDTPVAAKRNGALFSSMEDVDGDGDLDLILHFSQPDLEANEDLKAETTELFLDGTTLGGTPIAGHDDVYPHGSGS